MTSREYLISVGKKVEFYYNSKIKAIRYIKKNKIQDSNLQTNLLLISAIWSAYKLKQTLTEDDLLSVFGLSNNSSDYINKEIAELHPDHRELTLTELFDMTVEKSC